MNIKRREGGLSQRAISGALQAHGRALFAEVAA